MAERARSRNWGAEHLTKRAFCSMLQPRSAAERRIPARFSTASTGETSKVERERLARPLYHKQAHSKAAVAENYARGV